MPRRDGTGPRGNGPLTGRGLGPCKDTKSNSNNNLEEKVEDLKDQLDSIKRQIDKLN